MKNASIDQWIQDFLDSNPPRSKSVVMTVFGDSITPRGGAVWLGSLIALLAPFGISDRLVRTSVFRLAEEGWLEASREGRRSLYTLTAPGLRRFERAYKRIYAPTGLNWDGRWTMLLTAPEIISASQRANLRKELLWEGFGMIAPGIFAHPGGKAAALEEILARLDVTGKVFVYSAAASDEVSSRPLSDLVTHCWELDKVLDGYRHFIDCFAPLLKLVKSRRTLDPEQAFAIRTLLIHTFRRAQLHDPQLPLELLPEDWPGTIAYELCHEIYQLTYKEADQHILMTLQAEDDNVPEAASYFYERFGGLS
ncbi:MAG TPA: phenylacetic acid degradation operon negative regulatory protein PaaX [Noviherbaspirillum sp.]|jgi:phenylacetic acid degradation operon negative regulatory protein|uniref:phenylacetic acid degradation operon negative regulatory protein PaaX n=1 Tax=Noviherbaspirillum sp. TaxID=1926288 RepID=UPI002DDC9CF3|nr:phenylacetic acid degradation operon negative regulatory protein PaaX [Noviherbaspirillum sp.]HEV2609711.1 phenylacetic acid degradation operon negative regulatory protein PaaX [Noviherbaspirillum sp.]